MDLLHYSEHVHMDLLYYSDYVVDVTLLNFSLGERERQQSLLCEDSHVDADNPTQWWNAFGLLTKCFSPNSYASNSARWKRSQKS